MHYIDIIIIIPFIWFGYKGYRNGFVIELSSLAALLLGVYGSIKLSGVTSDVLARNFDISVKYLPVISFAITFIIIVILVHLIARLTDRLVKSVALGFVNRIAGIVFSVAKVAFIISILFILLEKIDKKAGIITPEIKEKSVLYEPVSGLSLLVFPSLAGIDPEGIYKKSTK